MPQFAPNHFSNFRYLFDVVSDQAYRVFGGLRFRVLSYVTVCIIKYSCADAALVVVISEALSNPSQVNSQEKNLIAQVLIRGMQAELKA